MLTLFPDRLIAAIVYLYDVTAPIVAAFGNGLASLRHGTRPVFSVYLRQVYFTGLEAFKIIVITALIIGTVVITQIVSIAGGGSESLTDLARLASIHRQNGEPLLAEQMDADREKILAKGAATRRSQ